MALAQPLLVDAPAIQNLEPRIQAILGEIAEALWSCRDTLKPDLASGLSGAALFLAYLSRRPGFEAMKGRAQELLSLAVERVDLAPSPSLFAGFTGLAWCIEHLNGRILEAEEEDPNADVDEILLALLQAGPWTGDYDLISGLVGLGVYALERLPRPSGRRILERILVQLESLAEPCGPGLAWPTAPSLLPDWQRKRCPQGYWNLGLAHGMPGVLVLLAAMKGAGLAPERTSRLLEGGMAWLTGQTPLAAWIPLGEERGAPAYGRLAWCYGDLGASMALLQAAQLGRNPTWESLALDLARLAAGRPLTEAGLQDVSLCHGSAGNLHLFHRLYRATGEDLFREAALAYLLHTLEARVPGEGFAGFFTYRPAFDETGSVISGGNPMVSDPGLLDGAAGVGLALLSCVEPEDPGWDRFLLLSSPLATST